MRLLQLLLSSIFIFITVEHYYAYPDKNGNNESPTESSIESSTEDILHLPDIVPEHYKIQLELAAEEDMFYGDFSVSTENINWRGRQQSISDQSFASYVATTFTSYFETKWKELQNSSNVQHVTIPGLLDDGMAKWALISYREEDIIYNKELDPAAQQIKVISIIGRKISRQLLSTVVSPSSWSYMWLNEGIATFFYIEDLVKKVHSDYSDLFAIQTMQESLHLDVLSIMSPLISEIDRFSDINSFFSFSYYVKAPSIIRMLQHILGDKVFWNGINTYFKRQSASLNDFWADMQTAYDELSDEVLPINIKRVMDPWVEQKGFPVLFVQVGERYINIINDGNWMVPLTNTTQKYLDFNDTSTIMWLNSGKNYHLLIGSKLSLKNTWVIFNIQQRGYYRVNYINENWLKIARYLNSENYMKIHVLNRAQIIDDAFHLLIAKQLNFSMFCDLSKYLSQETDYRAWYPMIKAIEDMSYLFPFPEHQPLKEMLLYRLSPLIERIGYEEDSEDRYLIKCLRQEAVKWECVLGDLECKTEAVTKLKWHLEDPKNNTLLPWWRKWTYCNGLAVADDVTLWFYMNAFIDEKDTKMFEFFACSNQPIFILRTFIRMKSKPNNRYSLINKNYIDLFHYIVMRHARNNTILDFILDNWDRIKPKEIRTITALIGIINNVYSEKQLDKIMMFVENTMHKIPSTVHALIKNSLGCRIQNCTEYAELIRDNLIKFQICNIQTKITIRKSQIERQVNKVL